MPTTILDLWKPDVWIQALRESAARYPTFINSGAVAESDLLNQVATGGGVTANLPAFKDISDQLDQIQSEIAGPSIQGISAAKQIVPILNRAWAGSVTALSAGVSDSDPVGEITAQLAEQQSKQRNTTCIAMLRGLFGSGTAAGMAGTGALAATRLVLASETGAAPPTTALMTADAFVKAKVLMSEKSEDLLNGCFVMHPAVAGALELLDGANFVGLPPSGMPFALRAYRGVPVYLSEVLVRNGTTSGKVYDSYLLARGVIKKGEKPKISGIDVASLQLFANSDLNQTVIYNYSRYAMHVAGTAWGAAPAGQSATDAELASPSNWSLVFQSANRCGAACILTNG